jgi:general secretion pathway protein D
MPLKRSASQFYITALTAVLAVSTGCNLYRANKAFDEGKYEEAARTYSRLVQQDPSNVKAKMGYKRSAVLAAEMHLFKAKEAEKNGKSDVVEYEIIQALRFDPQNSIALDWFAAINEAKLRDEAFENAEEDLRVIRDRVENEPVIKLAPKELFLNEFNVPNQPLRQVFKLLEKNFEISFLFHSTFTSGVDSPIIFSVKNMSLERILDTLALQNDLFYRYIDTKTVMVFKGAGNAAQRAEYENQQYKTIYLDNAKPQEIVQTLSRLIGQGANQRIQISQEARLNAIIVKGRPNDIKTITRMVRQLDKAKAEVMVYIELLEVTESSMEQVGLLPVMSPGGEGIYKIGATIDNTGGPNINKGAVRISKSDINFLFPSLQLDALKNSGDAKMAAKQNMRISSDTAAVFNFGDKVFVVTGTPTTSGSSALSQLQQAYPNYSLPYGNNYQQQDVGVKVQITPRVHHNDEITLDLKTEVTNLKASSNLERPNIGQRKLDTEVRMQNGETIIFGGLLREDEVKSKQGIWGISDIPLIGKLLGNNRKDTSKADVLLTVRCVIVRKPDLRADDFLPFDPDFTALQEDLKAEQKANKLLEAKQNAEKANATAATAQTSTKAPVAAPTAPPQSASSRQNTIPDDKNTPTPANQQVTENQTTPAGNTESATAKKPEKPPAESDLVLFLTPIMGQITKGETYKINMIVSGGRGVTSGEFVFRIDPKLKLNGIIGANFLTSEGGNISLDPLKDDTIKVKFQKKTASVDSGILLTLDLEGIEKGNAPIMVDSYKCFVGENPITANIQNALIEIE